MLVQKAAGRIKANMLTNSKFKDIKCKSIFNMNLYLLLNNVRSGGEQRR